MGFSSSVASLTILVPLGRETLWPCLATSQPHLLPALLLFGHSIRDGLMGGGALVRLFDEGFGGLHVAGFQERFHLVLGSDVIGWPHFFHAKFFGDDTESVTFLPEREQRLDGDFGTVLGIHRTRIRDLTLGFILDEG